MRQAVRLGDALWAGLAPFAHPQLQTMATDGLVEPRERAAAAHELAVWHLDRNEIDEADTWYGSLDDDEIEHAVVATHIDQRLGRSAAAHTRLVEWVERRPDDPHLTLHLANLETDSDQTRLELFNDVLRAGGAAPVVSSEPMPHPLHLRVDRTTLTERADGPLVTVIMPAFNAAETIAAALGSLLAQTHRQLQIIVVDDASSDSTVAIAQTLAADDDRISVVALASNGGAYAARNIGLERAAGAFVTVHDADDWAHPERIDRQVRHLEGAPSVPANATHWLRADPKMIFQAHGRHPYKIVGKSTASLMVRRELFGVIGPWDNALRGAADFEFLKRVETRFGAIHHLSRFLPLAVSLRTPGSLTGESATGIRSLWHVDGARRQYLEAFTTWNLDDDFPASLPFDSRLATRPFPVPALLTGGKTDSSVDVVVTADYTSGSNSARSALHDINVAVRDGRSVALWHQPDSLDALERRFEADVVDALRDGRARLLSSGETVHCIELRQHGSGAAGGSLDGGPQVVADAMQSFDQADYWIQRHQKYEGDPRSVGNLGKTIEDNLEGERNIRELVRTILEKLDVPAGSEVLDLGCGYGRVTQCALDLDLKYTGYDVSQVAVDTASAQYPTARFMQQDLLSWQPETEFDIVSLLYVLVHFVRDEEWLDLLRASAASVKPGGFIVVADQFGARRENPAAHFVCRSKIEHAEELLASGFSMRPELEAAVEAEGLIDTDYLLIASKQR